MLLLSALGLAALSSCQKGPTPLASPAPTVKATVHSLTFSWTAVDGAVEYAYQLDDAAGTKVADGKTEELSVSFDHLIEGAEYCFTITAYCAEGDSSHEISQAATVTASTKKRQENWTAEGFYFDGKGNYRRATLAALADGSYTLRNWYNIAGYDLDFTVDAENKNQLVITNANTIDSDYYYVSAGLEEDIPIYTISGYSNFSGDQDGGELYFWDNSAFATATFQWPAPEGNAVTADAIAGTYAQSSNYYYYTSSWESYTSDNDVTITKVDDTNITISNLIWSDGGDLKATLDPETGEIAIPAQAYYGWVFGGCSELSPAVGAYKDGVITLNGWNLWYKYDGYDYYSYYTYSTFTTLTKK